MKEVLKLNNVSKKYQAKNGEVEAISDISFGVTEGEFVSSSPEHYGADCGRGIL